MEMEPPVKWIGGGILPDDGFTLMYGPGGVGKSMVAVAICDMLAQEGYPPLVLDFEGRRNEWVQRIMGLAARNAGRIFYIGRDKLPDDILYARDRIAASVEKRAARAVVIDSYFFAAPPSRSKADPEREQAIRFAKIISDIGVPTLVLSHVSKRELANPKTPYGSVFIMNSARAGWSASAASDPGEPLAVALRHRKVNAGEYQPERLFQFRFAEKVPIGYEIKETSETRIGAILVVLAEHGGLMSASEIYREVMLKFPELPVKADSIRATCYAYCRSTDDGGRGELLERVETVGGVRFRLSGKGV
jgi:hypothetical protein